MDFDLMSMDLDDTSLEEDNTDNKDIKVEDNTETHQCTECNQTMSEGFCIDSGMAYYCGEECLLKNMTMEEYLDAYEDGGETYWTQW